MTRHKETEVVNIVNRSPARQVLNGKDGLRVAFAPGQGQDVDDESVIARAKRIKTFEIEGFTRTPTLAERSTGEAPREPEATDNGPLQQQLDDLTATYEQQSHQFSELETQLGERNTRVGELEDQLTTANQELEALRSESAGFLAKLHQVMTSASSPYAGRSLEGLTAKHKGRGSYSVVNAAGEELVEKLNDDQQIAFNAMSDVDKLVWIDAQWTPPKQTEPEKQA